MINLLAHTCFTMRPATDDVLTIIHTLLSKKAFLICARMPSYVESPNPTPSKLTESSLSSLLKLDSLESLEKEYRESSQLAITSSIKQVIQELSTNESDVVQSAYTPRTKEVWMQLQEMRFRETQARREANTTNKSRLLKRRESDWIDVFVHKHFTKSVSIVSH